MKLREYIEVAEKLKNRKELAEFLSVHPQQITDGKNGKAGLPIAACYKLAELVGEDERRVIAASELVTEKKPERRAILLPFVGHALNVTIAAVILNMTSTPAQAAPVANSLIQHCILCQII